MKYNLPVYYEEIPFTERKRVREQYIEEQSGLCFYCKQPLQSAPSEEVQNKWVNKKLFPQGMFEHPVHLQHDHSTGLTEGAVHARCNAVMWQYEGR